MLSQDSELSGGAPVGFPEAAMGCAEAADVPSLFGPSPFERASLTGYDSDDEGETEGHEHNASTATLSAYDDCTTDGEPLRRPLTRSCSQNPAACSGESTTTTA